MRILLACLLLASACQSAQAKLPPQAPMGIERVLDIEGTSALTPKEIMEIIVEEYAVFLVEGKKSSVDDAAWALERHLRGLGFPKARVRYEYERFEDGAARAKLIVEEGPRTFLDRITFVGVVGLDAQELLESFGERRSLLGHKRWFVEREVKAKITSIASHYRTLGFLEVQVEEPKLEFHDNDQKVNLTVTVIEGPCFYVREVLFSGVGDERLAALEALAGSVIGQPLVPRSPHMLRSRIVGEYARQGYPDAEVSFEVLREESSLDAEGKKGRDAVLLMSVEEGEKVRIAAVKIRGNEKTQEGFIQSRLEFVAGDIYDANAVQESFRELYRSRLFRKIDIRMEGDGPSRDLIVEVEELPSIEAWIEPGWGSYELARVAGGIRNRNFFGKGWALALEGTAAVRAQELILSLRDPFFFGTPVAATYSLFGNRRTEPFATGEVGVGVDLSRDWNRYWSSSLGYQYRKTDLEGGGSSAEVDISSIIFTTSRDSRDEIFMPTHGALNRASIEWGAPEIGSELDFFRLRYTQSFFRSVTPTTVVGFSVRGGLITLLSGIEPIPRQELFLNGGENTVRSFEEGELGDSLANGDPAGGEAFSATTLELRQRVTRGFDGALFVDAGNLEQEAQDAFEFRGLRYAVGFGIRYLLPIGPLRLDFAWNPDPNADEDGFQLHFSVGLPF